MVKNGIKVAQIVSTFPPYRGGMGNVAFHIADCLSEKKIDVTVLTPKKNVKDADIKSYFKIHKLVPQLRYGNAAVVFQLFFYLLKYNIVHLHYPFLGASLGCLIAKIIRGKKLKFVLHYHMDLVGVNWKSWVYRLYNKIFLKALIIKADVILTTSEDYLRESRIYRYFQTYSDKFHILPNGVNEKYFSPKAKDMTLFGKYNLENKKIVLFVGGLDSAHYFKGVNYLIKAFEIMNRDDIALVIVGDGNLRPVYQDMVISANLSDQVVFTGYVPDEQLVRYYNMCDVFVLPSIDKSEAFGMVLLEAMACGKAVIATDLPGVRKVVTNQDNGLLVKPKNVEKLAYKIQLILDNPVLIKSYGKRGREIVEEKYTWTKIIDRLVELYEQP